MCDSFSVSLLMESDSVVNSHGSLCAGSYRGVATGWTSVNFSVSITMRTIRRVIYLHHRINPNAKAPRPIMLSEVGSGAAMAP